MTKKIFVGLLVLIAIFLGGWYVNQPSKGTIVKAKKTLQTAATPAALKYLGNNLEFEYDSIFRLEKIESSDKNVIDNVHLIGNAGVPTEIVVTLKDEVPPVLEQVSGVVMRQMRNTEYQEEPVLWREVAGKLFTNPENNEMTAFFIDQGRLLTVAVVRGQKSHLDKIINTLVVK